jgi:hypothetical protein
MKSEGWKGLIVIDFDIIQVVLIGCGTGFGSALGVELSKIIIKKIQGLNSEKTVKKSERKVRYNHGVV